MTEIIAAIVSGVFALVLAHFNYKRKQAPPTVEVNVEEVKEAFRHRALHPQAPLAQVLSFCQRARQIGHDTEIDRILMLVAINGIDDPTHVTAIWDDRLTGEPFKYVHVAIDSDYNKRLKETLRNPHYKFKASEASGSLIGGIYEMEGVNEALWIHVGTKKHPETKQAAYLFMSWATHGSQEISKDTMRKIHNAISDLKQVMKEDGYVSDI